MSSIYHPNHYTECSLECIDVMVIAFGVQQTYDFCKMNAFKYLWRYKNKNGNEDIAKAQNYLGMARNLKEQYPGLVNHTEQLLTLETLMEKLKEGENS